MKRRCKQRYSITTGAMTIVDPAISTWNLVDSSPWRMDRPTWTTRIPAPSVTSIGHISAFQVPRNVKIVMVDHVDEVLARALAIADPEAFLKDGFHEIDDIFEVPPTRAATAEVPHPAGVN